MKCYYHYDEVSQKKILIPHCWGTIHSEDIEDCICQSETLNSFEKEKFNKVINEKDKQIEEMQELIVELNKKVEFWHKKYLQK